MLQATAGALGIEAIALRDDGAERVCGIAGSLGKAQLTESLKSSPLPRRAASLLITAAVMAMTSVSETKAEYIGPRASVHLAQATTSDQGTSQGGVREPEQHRVDAVTHGLNAARQDIESVLNLLRKMREESVRNKEENTKEENTKQENTKEENTKQENTKQENEDAEERKGLQQERERADRLEQALGAAQRDADTQTAKAAKAAEEIARDKQIAESTSEQLRKSLQQERDKSEALGREVSATRAELFAHEAQARKAGEEAAELKRLSESASELQKSLSQERERAGRLEQDLAAARRDVETQATRATQASEEAARLKRVADGGTAELRKSLQQERDRAEALAKEVSAARTRISAEAQARKASEQAAADLKPAAEGAAELQKSLQSERERAGRLEKALAAAQRDVETQTTRATKASEEAARLKQIADGGTAELQKSLQQEHDRAEALAKEVSTARTRISAEAQALKASEQAAVDLKQAAEGTAELQKSLQSARERAGRLEKALAAAQRDVETQTALAATTREEAARQKQIADASSAELAKSLQQERDRAETLAQEVSAAGNRISVEVQARKASEQSAADLKQAAERAAELQKSLQSERERAGRLEKAFAAAQRDVETQTALAAKARDEAAREKQVADSSSAELGKSLQQEREKGLRLERELALARSMTNVAATPEGMTGQPAPQREAEATVLVATAGKGRSGAQGDPQDAAEVARLLARANALLKQGDIGSARIVLERAAETGSAQASFSLAETYDPLVLPKWGTYGTRGDASKAQALYAKAEVGGIKEAKERSAALRR